MCESLLRQKLETTRYVNGTFTANVHSIQKVSLIDPSMSRESLHERSWSSPRAIVLTARQLELSSRQFAQALIFKSTSWTWIKWTKTMVPSFKWNSFNLLGNVPFQMVSYQFLRDMKCFYAADLQSLSSLIPFFSNPFHLFHLPILCKKYLSEAVTWEEIQMCKN